MIRLKCFHGTSFENGQSILRENRFRESDSDSSRMGAGAYFFCQSGDDEKYPIRCARELENFHLQKGKHTDGYAILSCVVECEEEQYLDLCDPVALEYFHKMRYYLLDKLLQDRKDYKYENAAAADTYVFDRIRELRRLAVIRCPQFFGMFAKENKFVFAKGRQFPKTYVPNVIIACVNTNIAVIKDIELVEGGEYNDGYEGFI